jgi:hypothetical protein
MPPVVRMLSDLPENPQGVTGSALIGRDHN